MTNKQPIPLTIIGGYLGAGKTTLLNHILRHSSSTQLRAGEGRRLAVIVNDFGAINIDAELIESQDEKIINLANGCICCTLVDGFAAALTTISKLASPPDHVIVEASGVADPYKLGQRGRLPGFRLDGVIVLADAEMVRQKAYDKYVGETVTRQLQGADVIVLNKTDLVGSETRKDVHTWLQGLVPDVRIVDAAHGVVPLPLLLGDDRPEEQKPVRSQNHGHHHPEQEYDTWSYTSDEPLAGDAFRALVESWPEGIIRAKGILYLRENPDQRHIFQLVGKRWSLKPGGEWGDTSPRSQLVIIGLSGSIDADWLEETIKD